MASVSETTRDTTPGSSLRGRKSVFMARDHIQDPIAYPAIPGDIGAIPAREKGQKPVAEAGHPEGAVVHVPSSNRSPLLPFCLPPDVRVGNPYPSIGNSRRYRARQTRTLRFPGTTRFESHIPGRQTGLLTRGTPSVCMASMGGSPWIRRDERAPKEEE